jgi:tetratricopeptide (TPR) repeat protein
VISPGLEIRLIRGAALVAVLVFAAWLDPLRDAVREGNRLFDARDYAGAGRAYDDARAWAPDAKLPGLDYNRGDADYMSGAYDQALEKFRGAARSDDPALRAGALFNAGNAWYKKGDAEKAADAWAEALEASPDFLPAKKNLEFLQREEEKKQGGDGERTRDNGNSGEKKPGDTDSTGEKRPGDVREDGARQGDTLDRDRYDTIMKSMRDKPVRRDRGMGGGGSDNEKPW